MSDQPHHTETRPFTVMASVWMGMLIWIVIFWAGGIGAAAVDVRWGVLSFAPDWLKSVGLLYSAIGLVLVLWSAYALLLHGGGSPNPLLMPPVALVTHGLYAYLRHPMYTGFIALAFGYGILLDSLSFTLLLAPGVAIVLALLAWFEERALARRHGSRYHEYRRRTSAFLPFLSRH